MISQISLAILGLILSGNNLPERESPVTFSVTLQNRTSIEKIALWPDQAPVGEGIYAPGNAFITVYHPAKPNGTAIVICPGGGYGGLVTGPEGSGIAEWLNQNGIVGIVLEYRLPKGNPEIPLMDAQRAVRIVRSKARSWKIDPKRIGIMGFSAGGHLASTAATQFDMGVKNSKDLVSRKSSRPDFAILIYPVITMGPKTHQGSKNNLLGTDPDEATVNRFSSEKQVTSQTPPTFLAHAQDDKTVSPDNSRMFYEALISNGVPATLVELPSGGHGLNGYSGPMWKEWQAKAFQWMIDLKLVK